MLVRKSGITRSDASRAVLSVFTDITERRAMEQAVRASETRFRDFTAAAGEFVWETDLEGRFTFVSSRVESVWGYSEAELIGRSPREFMPPGEAERVREWLAAINSRTARSATSSSASWPRSGETRWLLRQRAWRCSTRAARRIGWRGTGADITERKHAEERIAYLATRDPLTELPNRVLLTDRLQHALASARRRKRLGRPHVHRPGPLQEHQRLARPRGGRRSAAGAARAGSELRAQERHAGAPGRRRVRGRARGLHSAEDAAQVADKILRCLSAAVLHRAAYAGHQRQHRREHLPRRRRRRGAR